MHTRSLFQLVSTGLVALAIGFSAVSAHASASKRHATATKHHPAHKPSPPSVIKKTVNPGVSLDDAAESMRLRANSLNMKLVAELPLSSQVEAITGKPQRRTTIFQFCDALTARDLIELDIDFAIYMPCRIALIEDAKGQAWLVMMDIDVDALAQEKRVPPALKKRINEVRATLIDIMDAGAKGDL